MRDEVHAETSLAEFVIDGGKGLACTAVTASAAQLRGQAPLSGSDAISFYAESTSQEQLDLAKAILATIRAD
jgi:hypothetical protein